MPELVRMGIIGSRDYPDLEAVRAFVRSLPLSVVVVSGGARGVDLVAAAAARARGMFVDEFLVSPETWERLGPRAGPERNERLVGSCERVVAFWDGASRGTAQAIGVARRLGKPLEVRTAKRIAPGKILASVTRERW